MTNADKILALGNPLRRGLIIQNPASSTGLWVNFGASAANGSGLLVPPQGILEWTGDDVPVSDVHAALFPGAVTTIIIIMEASIRGGGR
ncbi:MAG: hypothetical protein ACYCVW_16680 [Rhodocyclaceae bacterium]